MYVYTRSNTGTIFIPIHMLVLVPNDISMCTSLDINSDISIDDRIS